MIEIEVNMSGKGRRQLTQKKRDWLDNNIPLLRRCIVKIVKKHKGPKRPCNSDIAKGLFPPLGDNGQNFTCRKLLDKMDGEELISEKDGESQGSPRRWRVNPHWHPK